MKDYRALVLLDTRYKFYVRVIARRPPIILGDIIQPSQYRCARERTILDAAAGILEVVDYVELSQRAVCILSLDFRTAFDKVSQEYL
jgi:Reverse transcriptase (RNA-dependent DNA polymerase).